MAFSGRGWLHYMPRDVRGGSSMAQSFDYDVIVIGSGPGGEGTAMKSVKSGGQVAVIDDKPKVGGNCTHRATIPSKALRHAIQVLADTGAFRGADFQDLLQRTKSVISEQVDLPPRARADPRHTTPSRWPKLVDGFTPRAKGRGGRRVLGFAATTQRRKNSSHSGRPIRTWPPYT